MSKLSLASANIRAASMGGLRTGLSAMRNTTPAPVTVIYGGGSSLPAPAPTGSARNHTSTRTGLNSPYEGTSAPQAAPAARPVAVARKPKAPAKAATVPQVKLPKRQARNLRQFAAKLADKLVGGAAHDYKVVEDSELAAERPAWRLYVRLTGKSRGKHVATIVA